jgi:hypothetical protein
MTREELVVLRDDLQRRFNALKAIGDYGVGAADIRDNTEATLKLAQHLVDRMRKT